MEGLGWSFAIIFAYLYADQRLRRRWDAETAHKEFELALKSMRYFEQKSADLESAALEGNYRRSFPLSS